MENEAYCAFSGKSFYNVTSFRLNDLGVDNTLDALMTYVGGFSPNARDILTRLKIRETCQDLQNEGMLHEVCMRFASFDLSPETVPPPLHRVRFSHLASCRSLREESPRSSRKNEGLQSTGSTRCGSTEPI